jgi:hypothetical protein
MAFPWIEEVCAEGVVEKANEPISRRLAISARQGISKHCSNLEVTQRSLATGYSKMSNQLAGRTNYSVAARIACAQSPYGWPGCAML